MLQCTSDWNSIIKDLPENQTEICLLINHSSIKCYKIDQIKEYIDR